MALFGQMQPFQKKWGNAGLSESGKDVVQLPSGTIFYCGFETITPGHIAMHLSRHSADGTLEQTWNFGLSGSMVPLRMKYVDGNLLLVGLVQVPAGDINGFLMRVDTSGNQLNWLSYGLSNRNEEFKSFDVDVDGNIVVCGHVSAANNVGNDAVLLKFTPQFNLIWEYTESYPENDVAHEVAVIDGNEYVLTGDRQVDNGPYNLYVARFSAGGAKQWEYFEFNGYNGGSTDLVVTSSNDIVVVGESAGPTWDAFEPTFARFTGSGEPVVQVYVQSSPFSDAAFAVCEVSEGLFLLGGYGRNPENDFANVDAMAILVNEDGQEINRRYYHFDNNNDMAFAARNAIGTGFLLAGLTGDFDQGFFLAYDFFDELLNLGQNREIPYVSVYPNPVTRGTLLASDTQFQSVQITNIQGRVYWVNHPNELIFTYAGWYHLRFFNVRNEFVGESRVIVR
ncbi:MAG: hypothetical protein EA392_05430 [Cryomorphaceae bacterium]|nr:MAG: hypothetical protein EA392_05430 [Cryomorphaceae bacterium]